MEPETPRRVSAEVIHGDCLTVMRGMADQSADAIVTDPPYGLDFRGEGWDSFIPQWIAEARRIAPVVVFTTAPTTLWDYPRPDWVCCWYRPASNARSMLRGGFCHWSPVVVYGLPKFPVDTINLHAIEHAYPPGFPHPSPKPVELMSWLVRNTTPVGGLTLDPFCGSGTIGVACIRTGRSFIGIEQELRYATVARQRIADASAQGDLLDGAA